MNRASTSIQPPRYRLEGFPARPIAKKTLWRAHPSDRDPRWFFSSGAGRFGLPAPHGTCDLATDAETALRERLGVQLLTHPTLSESVLHNTAVTTLRTIGHVTIADTTNRAAVRWGLTREIAAAPMYHITQAWAYSFYNHSFDGIAYTSHFTTTAQANAIALFGQAGEQRQAIKRIRTQGALRHARALSLVTPVPRSDHLTILNDPSSQRPE